MTPYYDDSTHTTPTQARQLTADQLEAIFHAALKAGDAKGVEAALRVMATVDPQRAADLYKTLDLALKFAKLNREDRP